MGAREVTPEQAPMLHGIIDRLCAMAEMPKPRVAIADVDMPSDFGDNVSDFLVFADFFFDGIIADWLVQSKIDSAKRQVDEAIEKVEAILRDLDAWERQL